MNDTEEVIVNRTEIIRDSILRFQHLPLRTIARYILHNYGPLFDNNIEGIRSRIRYQVGKVGEVSRGKVKDRIERTGEIRIPKTWTPKKTPYNLKPGLWLCLADVHAPFHSPKAIEAAVKYGQAEGVDGILLLGDFQDCAAITFWPSTAKRDFDKEVEVVIDLLDFIEQSFPGKQIVFVPGNHSWRLPRYYAAKAPELIGLPLLAMESALGFEYRNIEMPEYNQIVMAGKLPVIHGHQVKGTSPVNPARGLFLKTMSWSLCGHFHRSSEHTSSNIRGEYLTTWSVGCLCDLNPDYAPLNSWNWGFALINVEKNGNFEVSNRRILPSGAVV